MILPLLLLLLLGSSRSPGATVGGIGSMGSETMPDPTPVIATVEGLPITARALWDAAGRPHDPARVFTLEEKRRVLEGLAYTMALPFEAERRGYREDPRLHEVLRDMVLAMHVYTQVSAEDFTDEQRLRCYEQHREELLVPECVDLQRIQIRVSSTRPEPQARAEVEEIAALLRADPGDFERLAFERSDDLQRTYTCLRRDTSPTLPGPETAAVERAFTLPIGEISEPFRTPQGYDILRVTDRRGGEIRPFERARRELDAILLAEAKASARAAFLATMRAGPGVPASLTEEQLLDRAMIDHGLDRDWRVPHWMVDLLLDDELYRYDEPASLSETELRAFMASYPEAWRRPELFLVSTITVAVTPQRSEKAARAEATRIWQGLRRAPDTFEALVRASSDEPFGATGRGMLQMSLERMAYEEPALAARISQTPSGAISEPIRGSRGYTIVRVEARRPARELSFEEVESQLRQTLAQQRANERLQAFQARIVANARLVIDEAALQALELNQRPPEPFELNIPPTPSMEAPPG